MSGLAWGTVGEWVFGALTLLALGWAITETRRARKATAAALEQTDTALRQTETALDLQRARDGADAEHRRREQAALVSCHFQLQEAGVYLEVVNQSPAPIFDVRWFIVVGEGSSVRAPKAEMLTAPTANGHVMRTTVEQSMDRASQYERLCGVTFRDNSGARWTRWSDGTLAAEADDLTEQIAGAAAWARGRFGAV